MKTSLNSIVGYLVGEIAKEDNEFWCWAEFLGEDKENEKQRAYNHWKEAAKRHPDLRILLIEKTIEHKIVDISREQFNEVQKHIKETMPGAE